MVMSAEGSDVETVLKFVWSRRRRRDLVRLMPLRLLRQFSRDVSSELSARSSTPLSPRG